MLKTYVKHLRRSSPSPSVYSFFLVGTINDDNLLIPLELDSSVLTEEEVEFVDRLLRSADEHDWSDGD